MVNLNLRQIEQILEICLFKEYLLIPFEYKSH